MKRTLPKFRSLLPLLARMRKGGRMKNKSSKRSEENKNSFLKENEEIVLVDIFSLLGQRIGKTEPSIYQYEVIAIKPKNGKIRYFEHNESEGLELGWYEIEVDTRSVLLEE